MKYLAIDDKETPISVDGHYFKKSYFDNNGS